MKKLLLALTILAGFVAAAPRAEAGQFQKVYTRHGVQYVNKYSGLDASYYNLHNRRHHRHHRSYGYVPVYRSYPVYRSSYRSYPRYYDRGCYRSSHYSSRPRLSVSFGF
jgi:hypothetical protein